MSKVWLVWEDSYGDSWVVSVHETKAGAEAEAARLAAKEYRHDKREHDKRERERIDRAGAWMFWSPGGGGEFDLKAGTLTEEDGTVIQGEWQPADPKPKPEPFDRTLKHYERRITSENVQP